jgi:[acyl-carrier-protein] S-malonyltransferase
MKAYVFPGQGAQYPGMGKDLYDSNPEVKALFEKADVILGFKISNIMFNGTDEDLKQTNITQPAIFIHSIATIINNKETVKPDMVAGHSLGEFSALVAAKALSFEDGLKLVKERAEAMQDACKIEPSTMAAVIGLDDAIVEEVCASVKNEIVVAANYNTPGQLVISGSIAGIEKACELLKERGAKRALVLQVGGAFHSPLMEPARARLEKAINNTSFSKPICPIYQNVTALPNTEPDKIKANLIAQLTAPVRWTQTVENMIKDGAVSFSEAGPGNVLQGLVKKINNTVETIKL